MLKKRILASSMASVMALSSVSVVAFADETASSINTEAVTLAQLKEYVESLEKFVEDELDDYGTTMSENFENAYEAAKVVVEDEDATSDDITAAYQMLKAVKASLKMYTNAELKELVGDYKKTYETENILNEEFSDYIYSDDSWSEFESAYETAEDSLDDTDQRVINDAYADLEAAVKGLKANDKVTKSEFRSTYNKYIDLVNSFNDYEDWRRGKATVGGNDVTFKDTTAGTPVVKKLNFKGKQVTFGELKDIVYGDSDNAPLSLYFGNETGIAVDASSKKDNWIDFGGVAGANSDGTLYADVENAYAKFVTNSNSNSTTLTGIVTSYKAMKTAISIFEGWEVDGVKRGSKTSVEGLLDDYHDQIVRKEIELKTATSSAYKDVATAIQTALGGAVTVTVIDTAGEEKVEVGGTVPEGTTIKLDPETGYIKTKYNASSHAWELDYANGTKTVKVKAGDDITKYMPINTTLISTTLDSQKVTTEIDLSVAYAAFEACVRTDALDADQRDYDAAVGAVIDTLDIVTDKSTKSVAYPLVYRAMYYALTDLFPADTTYTKKQVSELIKDANELIDATGDAAKFKKENTDLDLYRKAATEWVAKANATKGYKDGDKVTYSDGVYEVATEICSGKDATAVYDALKGKYDKLNDEFKKYPVSFGDIAETIAVVAEGLDANAYGSSAAKIQAALADVAYDLSTLEWSEDCEAYDDDRNFIFYNRLATKGTDGEKAFYKKYTALLAAVEEAEKEPETPEVIKGDLTGDGVATPEDAIMIVKAFVGEITLTDAQKAAADFNGDGVVNADDALAVVKAYVGL